MENTFTSKIRDRLWNEPPVSPDSLTPEQREKYAKCGEHMYGQMDLENLESLVQNTVAYAVLQLRSGMDPSYLTDEEKQAMGSAYGESWPLLDFLTIKL
jgi:hypothetical protein